MFDPPARRESATFPSERTVVFVLLFAIAAAIGWHGDAHAQRIRRPKPSATAQRVGEAVAWETSIDAALARAKATGKRVFWYPPTVPGSPMDRKNVLDFYMRAGFFSDRPIVERLNADFVCLRAKPNRRQAATYGLRPYAFVEPGFAILDADGEVVRIEHSITTFSRPWMLRVLRDVAGDARAAARSSSRSAPPAERAIIDKAQALLAEHRPDEAERVLARAKSPEARFLSGASRWLLGDHDGARARWTVLAQEAPDDAYGWRAAAEAEGFGPFARGFWIFRRLPDYATAGTGPGTRAGIKETSLLRVLRLSLDYLVTRQDRATGGYEDSNYDFGGRDSLPNVYVATTAIAARALWRHHAHHPQAIPAVQRALGYVLDASNVNADDKDEWIWAKAYAMLLLADLLETPPTEAIDLDGKSPAFDRTKLAAALKRIVAECNARQGADGAFRHEYPNPFTTALVLVAFARARAVGVAVPQANVDKALASLERARAANGGYTYGQPRATSRRPARANVKASAGRMPLCELALFHWKKSDRERLEAAITAAFEHHDELERARKYDDHTRPLGYGGFFYWFDLVGREMCFEALGESAATWRAKQHALLLSLPEIDGCFVDSHELGRVYGTGMALRCIRPMGR